MRAETNELPERGPVTAVTELPGGGGSVTVTSEIDDLAEHTGGCFWKGLLLADPLVNSAVFLMVASALRIMGRLLLNLQQHEISLPPPLLLRLSLLILYLR